MPGQTGQRDLVTSEACNEKAARVDVYRTHHSISCKDHEEEKWVHSYILLEASEQLLLAH
ncbi:hypothetical protein HanXRQr2_Chr17g0830241 [Helianthus annuus]|uniref:Uncharacterized protein n=1 Tax=Helianthus annuus TaxID=4232 RepID=A0A9K3DLZ4_HELAN|nr:hypothetical protein HanXRQr2_Chr17g0830241 [Helianthus annuus]